MHRVGTYLEPEKGATEINGKATWELEVSLVQSDENIDIRVVKSVVYVRHGKHRQYIRFFITQLLAYSNDFPTPSTNPAYTVLLLLSLK